MKKLNHWFCNVNAVMCACLCIGHYQWAFVALFCWIISAQQVMTYSRKGCCHEQDQLQ